METVAIICEYNPFHMGHMTQIQWIRQQLGPETPIVCLMSGNFVQRGAPAMFEQSTRAAAAIDCGADVVLALPPTVSLRSAEGYAAGAVEILQRLGGIRWLCFGSEGGQVQALEQTAALLCAPAFPAALKAQLARGLPFAAARAAAVEALGGEAQVLEQPNDILGVEYCKALLQSGSAIEPLVLRRGGSYHAQRPDAQHPSATALRALLAGGDAVAYAYMPPAAAERFAAAPRYGLEAGERALLAVLRSLPEAAFAALPGGEEGLWSRFMTACRTQPSYEAILTATKSKRYARTRLQRMAMCAYLGIDAQRLRERPSWIRLLGLSTRGQQVLRQRSPDFCLISGGAPPPGPEARLEQRSADLFQLFAQDFSAASCWAAHRKAVYRRSTPENLAQISHDFKE